MIEFEMYDMVQEQNIIDYGTLSEGALLRWIFSDVFPKVLFLFPKDSAFSFSTTQNTKIPYSLITWGGVTQHACGNMPGNMPSNQNQLKLKRMGPTIIKNIMWLIIWASSRLLPLEEPLNQLPSDIMNFIFDQIWLNITLYFIWSTY